MAKLAISIAKAIGPYTHNSANMISAMLAAKNKNFSVTFAVLYRSVSLLRRFLVKNPGAFEQGQAIYRRYLEMDKPGTIDPETDPEKKSFCPPPGHGSRAA